MVTVIGLLGLAGAGKTTALEHVTENSPCRKGLQMKEIAKQEYDAVDENGISYLPEHIRVEAEQQHLLDDISPNGNFEAEISDWVDTILQLNPTYFASRAVEHIFINADETDVWIVDGIRTVADVEQISTTIEDTHFLYFHAPFHIRSERLLDRGRENEDDIESILERDKQEFSWGLDTILLEEQDSEVPYDVTYVPATHDGVEPFVADVESVVRELTE